MDVQFFEVICSFLLSFRASTIFFSKGNIGSNLDFYTGSQRKMKIFSIYKKNNLTFRPVAFISFVKEILNTNREYSEAETV